MRFTSAGQRVANLDVLVTGGDHAGVLASVRALRAAGHRPTVVVSRPGAYAARSRRAAGSVVLPDSRRDPAGFVAGLAATIRAGRFEVLMGGTESDMIAIAGAAGVLGPLAERPDPALVHTVTDKATVSSAAVAAGLHLPASVEIDPVDPAGTPGIADLGWPLLVKPLRSEVAGPAGGLVHASVELAASPAQAARLARASGAARVVLQRRVAGRLTAVCGVAWEGELVCCVHQTADRIWPPGLGISAYARTVPPDPELESGVARLLARLGWSGIFQAQFITGPDGSFFIDLNPRVYGSLALAVAAGANLPAVWVSLLSGSRPAPPRYRVGVRYRAEELDLKALSGLARRRPVRAAGALIPRRHTTHAVIQAADPLPALAYLDRPRFQRRSGWARLVTLCAQPGRSRNFRSR